MKTNNMDLCGGSEQFWLNPAAADYPLGMAELASIAEEYGSLAKKDFNGVPTSKLVQIPTFHKACTHIFAGSLPGKWYAKLDCDLPLSGSVKIRGALYELLVYSKGIAKRGESAEGRIVSVASTGNLGLSVGVAGRKLGFGVKVYMSKEASPWKMRLLTDAGAEVVVVDGDYTEAVSKCRHDSDAHGYYFVDDERSELLYRGYACAALEIAEDPAVKNTTAPIFVYIPCGVGNAPSGIAAGLKAVFGDRVHIFLAEPTEVPSVLAGLSSGKNSGVSVYEYGRSGKTVADGLACGRMAERTAPILGGTVSGIYTVSDDRMLGYLKLLGECEKIRIEPSAAAGLQGVGNMYYTGVGMKYLAERKLLSAMDDSVHISWLTGGGMLPDAEYEEMYKLGETKERLLCDFL